MANVCLRSFCYFITSVCRKFPRSLQELSFVCHSLLFVQLLASGKNSTKFKADTTQGVTQGKKNKLICVADFCPPKPPLCSVLRSPDLKCTVPFDSRRTQRPGENHYGEGVGVYMDLFRGLLGIKPWRMTQIKKRRRRKKFD